MKLKGMVITGIAIVIVLVLAVFAFMGFVFMDGMSYTATGSQTLDPAGAASGKALVVYDPGLSGQAKSVATGIAGDLRNKGYQVVLAGVRSPAAANVSGYDVIVVGGPVYAGNVSGSIAAYYKTLAPQRNARIGAFDTGRDPDVRSDPAKLMAEAAPVPADSPVKIVAVAKVVDNSEAEQVSATFVDELLK